MAIPLRCQRRVERLAIGQLRPARALRPGWEKSRPAARLAASIDAVGLVEPLIVTPIASRVKEYRVLDGHRRLALLVARGDQEVDCLVERHPVPFAYNAYVQPVAAQGVHQEVQHALDEGATADEVERAVLYPVGHLVRGRERIAVLSPETRARIGRRPLSERALEYLSRVRSERQLEMLTTMVSLHQLTEARTLALYLGTPPADLVEPDLPKSAPRLSADDIARIESELVSLLVESRALESQQGRTALELVVAMAYFRELLKHPRVAAYLSEVHAACFATIERIVAATTLERSPAAQA